MNLYTGSRGEFAQGEFTVSTYAQAYAMAQTLHVNVDAVINALVSAEDVTRKQETRKYNRWVKDGATVYIPESTAGQTFKDVTGGRTAWEYEIYGVSPVLMKSARDDHSRRMKARRGQMFGLSAQQHVIHIDRLP